MAVTEGYAWKTEWKPHLQKYAWTSTSHHRLPASEWHTLVFLWSNPVHNTGACTQVCECYQYTQQCLQIHMHPQRSLQCILSPHCLATWYTQAWAFQLAKCTSLQQFEKLCFLTSQLSVKARLKKKKKKQIEERSTMSSKIWIEMNQIKN